MKTLYSPITPYKTEYLPVSQLHSLYLEQSGNQSGIPVVVLHGGPGAKSKSDHRRYYNPAKYRIIVFDQRGCGKSTPSGEIKENTTQDLIKDLEKIRKHLKIKKWMVAGGSWGSTLALVYAETYPKVVERMLLRGIFLCRQWELDLLFQSDNMKDIFPDIWEKYIGLVKKEKQNNLFKAYEEILFGKDKNLKKKAFHALSLLEDARQRLVSAVDSGENVELEMTNLDRDSYKIYFHYIHNQMFLKKDQILKNINKIRHIPTVILHGCYDLVCPLQTAWDLHKAFPEAIFHIVPASSHKATEPRMTDKIIEYTDKFDSI